jgi:hypothetical protein
MLTTSHPVEIVQGKIQLIANHLDQSITSVRLDHAVPSAICLLATALSYTTNASIKFIQ